MSLKGLVSLVINLIGLAEEQRNNNDDAPLPSNYMLSSESASAAASNFNEDSWCCVCLSRLKAKDEIRVLPCSHKFHKICVNSWLKGRHKTCPLCRFSLGTEEKSHHHHRSEMFTEEMLMWFSSFHVAEVRDLQRRVSRSCIQFKHTLQSPASSKVSSDMPRCSPYNDIL